MKACLTNFSIMQIVGIVINSDDTITTRQKPIASVPGKLVPIYRPLRSNKSLSKFNAGLYAMGARLDKQCHDSNNVCSIIAKRFAQERIFILQKLIPSYQKILFIRLACAPFSNMKLGEKRAKELKSTYQYQKLEMTANKSKVSKAGKKGVTGTKLLDPWSRLKLSIA